MVHAAGQSTAGSSSFLLHHVRHVCVTRNAPSPTKLSHEPCLLPRMHHHHLSWLTLCLSSGCPGSQVRGSDSSNALCKMQLWGRKKRVIKGRIREKQCTVSDLLASRPQLRQLGPSVGAPRRLPGASRRGCPGPQAPEQSIGGREEWEWNCPALLKDFSLTSRHLFPQGVNAFIDPDGDIQL